MCTAIRLNSSNLGVKQFLLAALAAVGLGGLVGLLASSRTKLASIGGIVISITFWSFTFGWLLYAFTKGFVFDRFLMVWAFLLPIIWWTQLPRWLLALQSAAMLVIAVRLAVIWL